jgi:hypothetical protein
MNGIHIVLAATAAASYLVISAASADAMGRGGSGGGPSVSRSFGGGGSSGGRSFGGNSFRQSGGNISRSQIAPRTSAGPNLSSRSNGGGNFRQSPNIGNRQIGQGPRNGGVTPRIGNPNLGNNQVGQGPRGPRVGNPNNGNSQAGNQGVPRNGGINPQAGNRNPGNPQAGNQGSPQNGGINPQAGNRNPGNPQAGNQGVPRNGGINPQAGNQSGNARPHLAPELRSSLGLGLPKHSAGGFGRHTGIPVRHAVAGTGIQRARLGLPLNLAPRLSLQKAVPTHFHTKWRPFVQRHWKRTFFWVAVAGIGYVTVPEFGYSQFLTYVERDEPDYEGAAKWLNHCATVEEGNEVPRVAAPTNLVVHHVAKAEPAPQLDERFNRFVNRRWNSAYVWVQVPRVGTVTVPQTVAEQVQGYMANDPPNFEAALQVLEEAAAGDTVVAEAPQVETPTAQE